MTADTVFDYFYGDESNMLSESNSENYLLTLNCFTVYFWTE